MHHILIETKGSANLSEQTERQALHIKIYFHTIYNHCLVMVLAGQVQENAKLNLSDVSSLQIPFLSYLEGDKKIQNILRQTSRNKHCGLMDFFW